MSIAEQSIFIAEMALGAGILGLVLYVNFLMVSYTRDKIKEIFFPVAPKIFSFTWSLSNIKEIIFTISIILLVLSIDFAVISTMVSSGNLVAVEIVAPE